MMHPDVLVLLSGHSLSTHVLSFKLRNFIAFFRTHRWFKFCLFVCWRHKGREKLL
jgi:hypothetical protein